ncbi:protein of unknown function [Balnearium lithotrophicum]|uniref:Uncharacterized protein n=1 Tax=Balnearium lithotrophicum TaxID=223788 RepID=A0A521BK18_9BACT|nr:DUF4388 domain-containing protein [Balnearium lithotrophicum]SMO47422.1 protein of unknown function [Balnearium lithotrophicum]
MELKGSFHSEVELSDLFQVVTLGKKTGEVKLSNNGNTENITLFIEKGTIVNFSSNLPIIKVLKERIASGDLDFFEALKFVFHYINLWNGGKFLFREKKLSNIEKLGNLDALNVIMDYTKEKDEISKIDLEKILDFNSKYVLSKNAELPITFDRDSWNILVDILSGKSILSSIFLNAHSFKSGLEIVNSLVQKNILKKKTEEEVISEESEELKAEVKTIPNEKINAFRELLTEIMGPMGEFLVDETLEDLEVNELPVHLANEFIEKLLDKIPETCLIEGESCKERLKNDFEKIIAEEKGG